MFSALGLAVGQLADRRIVSVLLKSIAVTLVLFAVLGTISGMLAYDLLGRTGIDGAVATGSGGLTPTGPALRGLLAAVLVVVGTWLLFRIVALAVIQFFADEVVQAVEARHYPARGAEARPLGWRAEARQALRGTIRSVAWNAAALPPALALVLTGIGPAVLFALVNAVLLGRELADMVRLRHRDAHGTPPADLTSLQRFALGLVVVGLLAVPVVNLLAPVIGAATATHLVHRRNPGAIHVS